QDGNAPPQDVEYLDVDCHLPGHLVTDRDGLVEGVGVDVVQHCSWSYGVLVLHTGYFPVFPGGNRKGLLFGEGRSGETVIDCLNGPVIGAGRKITEGKPGCRTGIADARDVAASSVGLGHCRAYVAETRLRTYSNGIGETRCRGFHVRGRI